MRWAAEAVVDWRAPTARELLQECLNNAHRQIERSAATSFPAEVDDFLKLQDSRRTSISSTTPAGFDHGRGSVDSSCSVRAPFGPTTGWGVSGVRARGNANFGTA